MSTLRFMHGMPRTDVDQAMLSSSYSRPYLPRTCDTLPTELYPCYSSPSQTRRHFANPPQKYQNIGACFSYSLGYAHNLLCSKLW